MTKKDFELVATTLRDCHPKGLVFSGRSPVRCWQVLVKQYAVDLAHTNDQFDEEKILEACNYYGTDPVEP